jgi:hypothetical protein
MRKTRDENSLYDTIIRAAADGRGLRLSAQETKLLAAQPFIEFDPRLLKLEWRKIPGYERYEVSVEGHVRRGLRLLKPTEAKSRHLNITVYNNFGRQWRTGVHQLVAKAFHGEAPAGKPLACHKNGRPWDNRPDNLYWGDHEDNTEDAKRHASLSRGGMDVALDNAMNHLLGKSNA